MPEFPLSLRLIGLRVTKLKDLREDDNKGIKRVRIAYLPTTVWRVWIPTLLGNSSSNQLKRVQRSPVNGREPTDRWRARTMTTMNQVVARDPRRQIDSDWVDRARPQQERKRMILIRQSSIVRCVRGHW